ncbi:NmrA family protein [Phytohabitans houttuyneae]|uniref:NmrA family protein n=1 Tax=Phytohabitans houttuyneae TaxID=1076126 RepID=A0A6V8K348_9ACTN|nr:NmrA family protein [Phytohabitans houttuyneae]
MLGATGTTGRRLTGRLRSAGATVRAASRHGDVRFDWSDPGTWDSALSGAVRLYLMAPHELPVDPRFVERAVTRGVRHIVLLSSRGIEVMGDERLMSAERTVRGSGADWTILRADWFDQNFDEGFFQPAVVAGALAVPLGDARQAFVDADDIAAVAAAVLTGDGHAGHSYEVTGPDALSFAEAVRIVGEAAGRPVRFGGTDGDYLAQQAALGLPEEQTRQEIAAFTALREQGDQSATDTVRRITGHPPKSFHTYATEAAARGAWKE